MIIYKNGQCETNLVLKGVSVGPHIEAGRAEVALPLLVLPPVPVLGDRALPLGMEDSFHRVVQVRLLRDQRLTNDCNIRASEHYRSWNAMD